MNWRTYYKNFEHLTPEQVELFATPREVDKALQTYNKALDMLRGDKRDYNRAVSLLRTVSDDFPMFAYSAHLYGLILADQGRFEEANDYLKRVALLDIDDAQAESLRGQLKIINQQISLLNSGKEQEKKRDNALRSVKKEISITDILERAPKDRKKQSIAREEIAEINRKLGNENPSDLSGEVAREDRKENLKFTVIVLLIASLVLLFFYFGIRPAILDVREDKTEAIERLNWLEKELESRQEDQAIQEILEDYQNTFLKDDKSKDNINTETSLSDETVVKDSTTVD